MGATGRAKGTILSLYFHFIVIKLWEITAEELIQTNLIGLLPLVPLTKDGAQYEVIDEVTTNLHLKKNTTYWNMLVGLHRLRLRIVLIVNG